MYMNQIHRNTAAYDKSDLTNPITQLQQYQKLLQMQLAHVGLKRHGHVRVKRQQQVAQQNCNGINKYFSKINSTDKIQNIICMPSLILTLNFCSFTFYRNYVNKKQLL